MWYICAKTKLMKRFLRVVVEIVDENGCHVDVENTGYERRYVVTPLREDVVVTPLQYYTMVHNIGSYINGRLRTNPSLSALYPKSPYYRSLLPRSSSDSSKLHPIYSEWKMGCLGPQSLHKDNWGW